MTQPLPGRGPIDAGSRDRHCDDLRGTQRFRPSRRECHDRQRGRRVLITTWDGGGNTTPAYHLALHLLRRRTDVLLMGWPSMAARAEREAIPFTTYSRLPPWPEGMRLEHDDYTLMELMTNGTEAEADIVDVATSFRPDVVVIDCMMAAGFRAAATVKSASSVLCHTLYTPFYDVWGARQLGSDVAAFFSRAGQVLITVVPGLEAPRPLPDRTIYVGPICHPDPADAHTLAEWDLDEMAEPGDPWVLLSLSSTPMGQAEALTPILAALGSLPVRVLLTLGDVIAPEQIDAPENVTVRGYVPHDFVLPFADLVVSHGGLTTISAALIAGKPLVCIPQGRDQTLNSTRVEECGAGRMIPKDTSPADIARAVDQVLHDPSFRATAQRIADQSAPLGRGAHAADLIEELAAKGRTS